MRAPPAPTPAHLPRLRAGVAALLLVAIALADGAGLASGQGRLLYPLVLMAAGPRRALWWAGLCTVAMLAAHVWSGGHGVALAMPLGVLALAAGLTRWQAVMAVPVPMRPGDPFKAAQRGVVLGAMSAAIVHEINQPLAAIQAYAQAAQRWLSRAEPNLDEALAALAGVTQGVSQTYVVMGRIRALVRGAPADMAPVALDRLLRSVVADAPCRHGPDPLTMTLVIDAPHPQVMGDAELLRQLLFNLMANAKAAMAPLPAEDQKLDIMLTFSGGDVVLTLRDYGPGLACEDPFAAFVTTRPEGMGLGLAICRRIVEVHGGRITLENHPQSGAQAMVVLPMVRAYPAS